MPARRIVQEPEAVSQVGYVAAAWGVTLAATGSYAVALRLRGRRLLRRARALGSDDAA